MTRPFRPFVLLSAFACAASIMPAEAALWMRLHSSHQHRPTGAPLPQMLPYIGTYDAAYTYVGISIEGDITAAPVIFNTTLPDGFHITRIIGGNWNCSALGQVISCTSIADIPAPTYPFGFFPKPHEHGEIQIHYDVDPALVADAPFLIRATASNAANPHDPLQPCTFFNNCLEESSHVLQSWLKPTMSFSGNPVFTPGTQRPLTYLADIRGYNVNNGAAAFHLYLPQYVAFDHIVFTSPISGWTCAPVALGFGRTRVDCTTPALHNATTEPYGTTIGAAVFLNLDPATPVPGHVDVFTTMENAEQSPATDCFIDPLPVSCARISIPVAAAPAPRLVVERSAPLYEHGIEHSPSSFTPGGPAAGVALSFANAGNAAAETPFVDVQLPPGLAYVSAFDSLPAANCTASGTVAAGQRLRCATGALAVSPGHRGRLSLVVQPTLALAMPEVQILGAVRGNSGMPVADSLADCAVTPGQLHCATDTIPVAVPATCSGLAEGEGIYCNGFEQP